jgi:hypothetical protein
MKKWITSMALSVLPVALAAGCASQERRAEIPSGAQVVAEGNNKISYTAPRDGTVWVFNQGNGNMEYSGRVMRGDMVVVDPDKDKIFVNGKDVNDKPMTTLDQKRIFFDPDSSLSSDRKVERVYEERVYERR